MYDLYTILTPESHTQYYYKTESIESTIPSEVKYFAFVQNIHVHVQSEFHHNKVAEGIVIAQNFCFAR